MTLSKLPVLSVQKYPLPHHNRQVLVTKVAWQGAPLTVVNAHLGTVLLSSLLRADVARVRQTRDHREDQIQLLADIARKSQTPLLLGSDLNTPPRGLIYSRLQTLYGPDAHDEAGRGPGWTFPSLRLRIDHLFSRDLRATKTTAPRWTGSDHRPVVAEFERR